MASGEYINSKIWETMGIFDILKESSLRLVYPLHRNEFNIEIGDLSIECYW